MAEELDLHLLKLARAKRKVTRRDFVAKALAHLRDAKRHANASAIADVLEIDKNPLAVSGRKNAVPSSPLSVPT